MNEKEFREFIEGPDGAELKPHFDRMISVAVNTYKANHGPPPNLDEALAAAKAESTEALTAKDRELLSLKIENAKIRECHKRNIPEDFLQDVGAVFETVEEVSARMEKIGARFEQLRTAKVNLDMSRGFKPGVSTAGDRETLDTMSPERALFLEQIGELDDYISGE